MTTALVVVLSLTTLLSVLWAMRLRGSVRDQAAAQREESATVRREEAEPEAPYRVAGAGVSDQARIASLVSENARLRQQLVEAQAAFAAAEATHEEASAMALARAQADTAIQTLELQHSNAEQTARAEVLRLELDKARLEADIKDSENEDRAKRWAQRRERLEGDNGVLASLSPAHIAQHFSALILSLEQEQSRLEEQSARLEEERQVVDAGAADTEVAMLMQRKTVAVLDAQLQACRDRLQEVGPDLAFCRGVVVRAKALAREV